ncbi:MAG: alpha/beta hydrolase [Bacteroidetes bacterium]|nr:MAG: alpha/beta hydrolase [Bacteroidota bacterium]
MDNKTHIYFMPGLAASPKIFEYIRMPENQYVLHFLEWLLPETSDETLENYCKRLSKNIIHKDPVLIGVSFGGMIVQELGKIIPTQKIVVISSIKNNNEKPRHFVFMQKTRFYKLFPSGRISKMNGFPTFGLSKSLKRKLDLYNKYLGVRDKKYLDWAVYNVLHWKMEKDFTNLIHIHGSEDEIFPIKYIKNSIIIEGGTHAMIITKAKKISQTLEEFI